jgi:predicted dehydrogenase
VVQNTDALRATDSTASQGLGVATRTDACKAARCSGVVGAVDMVASMRVAGAPAKAGSANGDDRDGRVIEKEAGAPDSSDTPVGNAEGLCIHDKAVRRDRTARRLIGRGSIRRLKAANPLLRKPFMSTDNAASSNRAPIRVGLVGVGNWALHGHLRVLSLLPRYQLSAIYAQRQDAAKSAAEKYDIRHVVGSLDDLVNHPEVDLVVVLTTAPQHEVAVRAAIAARKDVYCEWPLTPSTKTSEELLRLADEAGVRTLVGLQRRLAPHNRFVRDLLRDDYVGKLRSVRMHVSMNYFQALRSQALRWTAPPENFSSVVAIYAGHFLDMLFAATGWPASASALLVNQFREIVIKETGEVIPTTTPDQLVVAGTIGEDAVLSVHIEGGKRNGSGVQIDISGDAGDLRITNRSAFGGVGDDYVVEGAHGDDLPLARLEIPASYDGLPPSDLPSAVLELAHLYAAYADGSTDGAIAASTFEDAIRMHRLLDAFKSSAESGERVDASEWARPENQAGTGGLSNIDGSDPGDAVQTLASLREPATDQTPRPNRHDAGARPLHVPRTHLGRLRP